MRVNIKGKITMLAILAAILPLIAIFVIAYYQKNSTNQAAINVLDEFAIQNIEQTTTNVYEMLAITNDLVQLQFVNNISIAKYQISEIGELSLSNELVEWEAINSETKKTLNLTIPKMNVGNKWLGKNFEFKELTPIVDKVMQLTYSACAIYQRVNHDGDMLSIASNIETNDGKRAIGNYIPFINNDGAANLAISKVLAGSTYQGFENIENIWYNTIYVPLKDQTGEVIGMLYLGIQQESIESLRQAVADITVGKTGYVFIINNANSKNEQYILADNSKITEDNLLKLQDENGNNFISLLKEKAKILESKEILTENFLLLQANNNYSEKIASIAYFEPMDWIICSSTYTDDFVEAHYHTTSAIEKLIYLMIISGLVCIVIVIIIAIYLGNKLSKPIIKLAEVANDMSKGQFIRKIEYQSTDEVGKLCDAFRSMQEIINNMQKDTNLLINAAAEGRLDYRTNASKYKGGWQLLMNDMNLMLDNLINPLNLTAEYIDRISKGDIPAKISEEYKGDFNEIKNNINLLIDSISALMPEIQNMVSAVGKGDLNHRTNYQIFHGAYQKILLEMNNMAMAIQKPIDQIGTLIEKLAVYDTTYDINEEYSGAWAELKNSGDKIKSRVKGLEDVFVRISNGDTSQYEYYKQQGRMSENDKVVPAGNKMIASIIALIEDADMLAQSAIEGKLDRRADIQRHNGDYQKVVLGLNKTLDSIINPLNVAAEYIDRISKGDLPPIIVDEYKGDFNEIKNNINQCIEAIRLLIKDANDLASAAKEGNLYKRANHEAHLGDFREIIKGVNNTLDSFILMIDQIPGMLYRCKNDEDYTMIFVSKGAEKLTGYNYKVIRDKIDGVTYSSLIHPDDANYVNSAINIAVKRKEDFELIYRIIDINKNVKWVWEQGRGLYNDKGEFYALEGYIMDINEQKTLELKIQKTAYYQSENVSMINQNLLKLANGDLNLNLDITDADEDTKEIKETFEKMTRALSTTKESLQKLIDDSIYLAQAACEGKLDIRANASRHNGEYRKIIEGVNNTLDSVIGPLNVAAEYVDRIAKGDMPPLISEDYKGDFNEIKNNLNTCINAINLLISDVNMLAQNALEGKLDTRADSSRHEGDFAKIVKGFNATLDSLIEPIQESSVVLDIMATGDLTARMKKEYQGELAKLKLDINTLGDSLSKLISNVNDVVEVTAHSAGQISATAETLASSSQEQSAQADEVASAVEEMSRTISENSNSANKTATLAERNGIIAKEGEQIVKQTVHKMNDIAKVVKDSAINMQQLGESSQQIGEIISVINDIADQTNLLALNAAIEAARAGEQGRGFAVVADEVRKLAERTTEATKQIAVMIKGIQSETDNAVLAMNQGTKEVQSGIELADKAGNSLNEVLVSTNEVIMMISQIAVATEEQSATSEEISRNVLSISKVTAESAHRIEDVAQTSNELSKMTEQLYELMKQFKIENSFSGNHSELSGKQHNKLQSKF